MSLTKPAQIIAYGLAVAGVLLGVCILIRPHGLAANDGTLLIRALNAR